MNIREFHVQEMRSRVEHILTFGSNNSAKEIIETLSKFFSEWTNVAFSPEEIVIDTMSSDMDDFSESLDHSYKFDIHPVNEDGDKLCYTLEISTFVKIGDEGSSDDDYCRTFRVFNEYEDVSSVELLSGSYSVNTLEDLNVWMHEYIEQHEEEPVFPLETLQLLCERNGWAMSDDHLHIKAEDGSVFPIIAKEFWKTAQSIEASPEEISIDYASTRRKECDDIAKDDFLDVYGYEEEDARNVLTCLYRYDQASVRRIIDEMNRNGWFDW